MPPAPLRRTATVPIPADGPLRLAVVADTHSHPHPATHRHLAALAPHAILHAGDIGDESVISDLAGVAPVHVVRGNIDTRATHPDILIIDLADRVRIFLTHIAVNGPRLRADVARQALAERADLVVCGHSHVPFIGRDRGLAILNPGSCGPRRFALPIVFALLTLSPDGVSLAHIDCETGQRWHPP